MKRATDKPSSPPMVDQRVLARLSDAVRAARAGRRPPLTEAELRRFGDELRPGFVVDIDVRETDDPNRVMIAMRFDRQASTARALETLTPREREVATLIAHGLSNREIAAHLSLSLSTVKDHVHHVLARMKVRSRLAVAAAVIRDRAADGSQTVS